MKNLYSINKTKSKWASDMVKEYGPIVQLADERDLKLRFVSPKEDDVNDFTHWSYWVEKSDIEMSKI